MRSNNVTPLPQGERGNRVLVARVGAAHGVLGEVRLWSFTEDPLAVAEYGTLETQDGERHLEIESLRPVKDCLIARFKGVAARAEAEALRNVELFVPRERLPTIEENDTFYVVDLVGLDAVTPEGDELGTVTAVHNFGAGDIVEIASRAGGPTLLLPFTKSIVPDIDLVARKIVVATPDENTDDNENIGVGVKSSS